eukprot:TRINITY_DN622_c0_g1_i1.p1 TRINITY_DN622_c0_g1~~TRINITY_DN622_c0_g1_i1.p1  ORF type:complete len:391 (+),score=122.04 TRINITY_DN622_c0_g1_i1:50-1222(+)
MSQILCDDLGCIEIFSIQNDYRHLRFGKPNPSKGVVDLKWKSEEYYNFSFFCLLNDCSIEIYNVVGETLLSFNLEEQFGINMKPNKSVQLFFDTYEKSSNFIVANSKGSIIILEYDTENNIFLLKNSLNLSLTKGKSLTSIKFISEAEFLLQGIKVNPEVYNINNLNDSIKLKRLPNDPYDVPASMNGTCVGSIQYNDKRYLLTGFKDGTIIVYDYLAKVKPFFALKFSNFAIVDFSTVDNIGLVAVMDTRAKIHVLDFENLLNSASEYETITEHFNTTQWTIRSFHGISGSTRKCLFSNVTSKEDYSLIVASADGWLYHFVADKKRYVLKIDVGRAATSMILSSELLFDLPKGENEEEEEEEEDLDENDLWNDMIVIENDLNTKKEPSI